MKKSILFFALIIMVLKVNSQAIGIGQLFDMLNWNERQIDTTLKKSGYLLMQKDIDSTSALYQYSYLEVEDDAPVTIRSLIYMNVMAGNLKSRLITYRTYSKEEFQDIASYLLRNDYHAGDAFDFGEAKHTLYSNGNRTVRLKVITTRLRESKPYVSYEVELGK